MRKYKHMPRAILFLLALSQVVGCSSEEPKELLTIKGSVTNVSLVAENKWPSGETELSYSVLTLSDGNKYRLSSEIGGGIGKGFDVELMINKNSTPNTNGEIDVLSVKIIAIPVQSHGKTQKYPIDKATSENIKVE